MVGIIRFGWARRAHDALQAEAFGVLPASPLKQFVVANEAAIHQQSALQDSKFMGPGHYLNAETLWEPARPTRLNPGERDFTKVSDHFQASSRQGTLAKFDRHAAQLDKNCSTQQCHQPANVYQAILKAYGDLVKTLVQAGQTSAKANKKEKQRLSAELVESLGELIHYAGDVTQPMHTTGFFNWPLPHNLKKAHQYFEGTMLDDATLAKWQQGFQAAFGVGSAPAMASAQVGAALKAVLKKGYDALYDIVETDVRARQQHPNRSAYEQALKAGWMPVAKDRLDAASLLVAGLLHSAYTEAGKPAINL